MQSFANRLQKVSRHISKWAKRQGITCYRIYDMDMPEFPFCIDRYEDNLHIAEYKANHRMSDEEHDAWLESCIQVISDTLQVNREHIYLKERRRLSRRTEQYEKVAGESKKTIVQEQGFQFHVNLTDYLDTGLFLDHRPLRSIFKAEADGKNVLNLFAYTGAFTVYAAAGNAAQVTTVDLSNTYIQWSKENMELNGLLDEAKHRFIQGDVMDFLKKSEGEEYDLVFVDPPAFSNSKRLKGTWDTQRDHPAMLHLILKRVKPGGIIYFSNNLRNFTPDFSKLPAKEITDISLQTIPEDFRNKKIHYCYRIIK
ncbi:MAG: class I SAM-dependent methyltransferase [Taibaiella sp.]|jgi:23S rRNA (cytosine1962-C5)-methyltransferase